MLGACSRRCRHTARGGGARRGGGVGVALPVDAAVRCREDFVDDLAERSDGLVKVQAERGEVVDRGLRHGPPRTDGDYSEAVRKVPLSLVVGGIKHVREDSAFFTRGQAEAAGRVTEKFRCPL